MTANEKDEVMRHELQREWTNDEEDQKRDHPVEDLDYSGAHEKTDPKEIALVRKLDRWIMPMCVQNFHSFDQGHQTDRVTKAMGYVLAELP